MRCSIFRAFTLHARTQTHIPRYLFAPLMLLFVIPGYNVPFFASDVKSEAADMIQMVPETKNKKRIRRGRGGETLHSGSRKARAWGGEPERTNPPCTCSSLVVAEMVSGGPGQTLRCCTWYTIHNTTWAVSLDVSPLTTRNGHRSHRHPGTLRISIASRKKKFFWVL
jgi:hypothetical protein